MKYDSVRMVPELKTHFSITAKCHDNDNDDDGDDDDDDYNAINHDEYEYEYEYEYEVVVVAVVVDDVDSISHWLREIVFVHLLLSPRTFSGWLATFCVF